MTKKLEIFFHEEELAVESHGVSFAEMTDALRCLLASLSEPASEVDIVSAPLDVPREECC